MFKIDEQGQVFLDLSDPIIIPANATFLLQALAASPYAEFKINHPAIESFFAQATRPNLLMVASRQDATLSITISADKMTATAVLQTPQGGRLMSLENAKAILVKAGVSRGFKQAWLEALLAKQLQLKPGKKIEAVIAQGKPAEQGLNAQLIKQVTTLSERIKQPQELADGRMDLRDFGKLASVGAGTILIKVQMETPGKEGYNVVGDTLPTKPGVGIKLVAGDGTEIPPDDPLTLISTQAGVPIDIENGIRVDDIFTIKDVCVETGHIDFDGSVLITQNVDPSMKVKAKGDINILGTIDGAEIIASGNITVKQGIIGHLDHDTHQLSTVVRCDGDLHIGHAQYASLSANNIIVERQTSHCEMMAKNSIRIAEGKKGKGVGKLIGGKVLDAKHILVAEIGTESGAKTEISIMQAGHQLIKKHDKLLEQLHETEQHLLEITEKKRLINALPNSLHKQEAQAKISQENNHWLEQSKKLHALVAKFNAALHFLLDHSDIKISHTLHPGVEFHLFTKNLKTSRTYPACTVHLKDNAIEIEVSSSNIN